MYGIAATVPCIQTTYKQSVGANVFITYNATSAYIQDTSAPSTHFTFNPFKLADGTECYYVVHCPWYSQYNTTLPTIGGYESVSLDAGPNGPDFANILLNAYYK